MITFKEYYQGDKLFNYNTPGKYGKNAFSGMDRKHQNITRQEYNHKNPHVNSLINGSAQQIKLMGQPLMNVLREYGVNYQSGVVKTLGNSNVGVRMFDDEEGNHCGMLINKDNGALQPNNT